MKSVFLKKISGCADSPGKNGAPNKEFIYRKDLDKKRLLAGASLWSHEIERSQELTPSRSSWPGLREEILAHQWAHSAPPRDPKGQLEGGMWTHAPWEANSDPNMRIVLWLFTIPTMFYVSRVFYDIWPAAMLASLIKFLVFLHLGFV